MAETNRRDRTNIRMAERVIVVGARNAKPVLDSDFLDQTCFQ